MKKYILLCCIILFAAFLRVYKLDTLPSALYGDEVSQAYNAYSILTTGRDEHQEFLPIARFKAFGDYKAPVLIYLDVVSLAIFGKNDFAVRFPSAFLGTLTVVLSYFLVLELFSKNEKKKTIALITAFFLAISPWHIQLSRATFEGNVATFFTVLGAFLFLFALQKKRWYLILSVISFVLAFYAFNAHRVFVPLLVLLFSIVYRKQLFTAKKYTLGAIGIGVFFLLPFLFYFITPESRLRFNEVNIFTNLDVIRVSNEYITQDNGSVIGRVIHNRRVLFAQNYLSHYFDFFNPRYLFFTGDGNPRFSLQDNGQLFLWILPFLLIGSYRLILKKDKPSAVIFGWFILAPVAAATARETPHALRTETFIPTYEILAATGVVYCAAVLKKRSAVFYRCAVASCAGIIAFSVVAFLHNYFIHYPYIYSGVWQYGYKEAIAKVEKIKQHYDKVVFTNAYGRAYIYILWYADIPPEMYWATGNVTRDIFGFYTVSQVDKYEIPKTLASDQDKGKKVLYVAMYDQLPSAFKVFDSVKFINGKTAFVLAERGGDE